MKTSSAFVALMVCCMSTAYSQEAIIGYNIDTEVVRYPDDADLLRSAKESLSNVLFDHLMNPQLPVFVIVEDGHFRLRGRTLVPAGVQVSLSVFRDSKTILSFFRRHANEGITYVKVLLLQRPETSDTSLLTDDGHYRDQALKRLDYLLVAAASFHVHVTLVLADNTPEIGGIKAFTKNALGNKASEENHDLFWSNEQVMTKFEDYLELLVSRVNTFSGVEYVNDPTILSWELGRNLCFSSSPGMGGDGTVLRNWIRRMVAHVRSLDSNRLIASGENGFMLNSTDDYVHWNQQHKGAHFASNLEYVNVDYATVNISPDVWNLEQQRNLTDSTPSLLHSRSEIAKALGMPLILEYGSSSAWFLDMVQEAAKTSGYSGFLVDWRLLYRDPSLFDRDPTQTVRKQIYWAAAGAYDSTTIEMDRWKVDLNGDTAALLVESKPICPCDDSPPSGIYPCSFYRDRGLCGTSRVKERCQITCDTCLCASDKGTEELEMREEDQVVGCTCTDVPRSDFSSCEQQKTLGGCDDPGMEGYCRITCGACECPTTAPQIEPADDLVV